MKLDNLAVVFIGTDKYLKFLPSWYQTCEEKLVPNIPKQYFVFTDGQLRGNSRECESLQTGTSTMAFHNSSSFFYNTESERRIIKVRLALFLDADMVIVDTIVPSDLFGTKP